MATFNEPAKPLESLVFYDPQYSVEKVTIASGAGVLAANRVLGKVTASGKYKAYDNTLSDGTEVAAAILLYPVDATSADVEVAVLKRFGIVDGGGLDWGGNDSTGQTAGIADLAAINPPVLVRT